MSKVLEYNLKINSNLDDLTEEVKRVRGELKNLQDDEFILKLKYEENVKEFHKIIQNIINKSPDLTLDFKYELDQKALEYELKKIDKNIADNYIPIKVDIEEGKVESKFKSLLNDLKKAVKNYNPSKGVGDIEKAYEKAFKYQAMASQLFDLDKSLSKNKIKYLIDPFNDALDEIDKLGKGDFSDIFDNIGDKASDNIKKITKQLIDDTDQAVKRIDTLQRSIKRYEKSNDIKSDKPKDTTEENKAKTEEKSKRTTKKDDTTVKKSEKQIDNLKQKINELENELDNVYQGDFSKLNESAKDFESTLTNISKLINDINEGFSSESAISLDDVLFRTNPNYATKSEGFHRMLQRMKEGYEDEKGLGYGIFGTGSYFAQTDELIPNEKAFAVNKKNYKLLKANDKIAKFLSTLQSHALKEGLGNDLINFLDDDDFYDTSFADNLDIDKFYERYKEAFKDVKLSKEQLDKFIKDSIKQVREAFKDGDISEEGEFLSEKFRHRDSISTQFVKSLGYEGIDASGTKYDNFDYGSVIYDLKKEDLIKEFDVTKKGFKDVNNFKKELSQPTTTKGWIDSLLETSEKVVKTLKDVLEYMNKINNTPLDIKFESIDNTRLQDFISTLNQIDDLGFNDLSKGIIKLNESISAVMASVNSFNPELLTIRMQSVSSDVGKISTQIESSMSTIRDALNISSNATINRFKEQFDSLKRLKSGSIAANNKEYGNFIKSLKAYEVRNDAEFNLELLTDKEEDINKLQKSLSRIVMTKEDLARSDDAIVGNTINRLSEKSKIADESLKGVIETVDKLSDKKISDLGLDELENKIKNIIKLLSDINNGEELKIDNSVSFP